MLILDAPAKLNLFLHITGQRCDGYHELQTIFQLLDYGDTLSFEAGAELKLVSSYDEIPAEQNLIIKAAKLLQNHSQTTLGATIGLTKRLPSGGGIGGGSSDAATTLLGLNHLWGLGLSLDVLAQLGATLGADVPVFVYGNNAWAEGIGEKLSPITLPKQAFLVIYPDCSVATKIIFSDKRLTRDTRAITLAAFLAEGGRNDCESVVRNAYPNVDKALNWLANYTTARLTGTGACVFGQFDTKSEALAVQKQLPKQWQSFVAMGVKKSPSHQQLGLS